MTQKREQVSRLYRPRDPESSPFYQLIEKYFDEFEQVYPDRYGLRFGFWRPIIRRAIDKFLKCGDLRHGFARVRCPKCGQEFFVALACHSYCTSFVQAVSFIVNLHFFYSLKVQYSQDLQRDIVPDHHLNVLSIPLFS